MTTFKNIMLAFVLLLSVACSNSEQEESPSESDSIHKLLGIDEQSGNVTKSDSIEASMDKDSAALTFQKEALELLENVNKQNDSISMDMEIQQPQFDANKEQAEVYVPSYKGNALDF